jgi:hypothetical protein
MASVSVPVNIRFPLAKIGDVQMGPETLNGNFSNTD